MNVLLVENRTPLTLLYSIGSVAPPNRGRRTTTRASRWPPARFVWGLLRDARRQNWTWRAPAQDTGTRLSGDVARHTAANGEHRCRRRINPNGLAFEAAAEKEGLRGQSVIHAGG